MYSWFFFKEWNLRIVLLMYLFIILYRSMGFPGGSDGVESACKAGDVVSIPGLGRSPGEGNGNPLQYSCQGKPMKMSLGAYSPWGCKRVRHNLATKPQHHIVCFDLGSVPGLGRSPGKVHGNALQYSYLENTHGQRSLAGCSPWDHKDLDTAGQLSAAWCIHTFICMIVP